MAERSDIDMAGCMMFHQMHDKSVVRNNAKRELAEGIVERKKKAAEKKAAEELAAAELLVRWRRCNPRCVCEDGVQCSMPKLQQCPTCRELKPNTCRKAKCLAAPVYGNRRANRRREGFLHPQSIKGQPYASARLGMIQGTCTPRQHHLIWRCPTARDCLLDIEVEDLFSPALERA